eukprot:1161633-Pelagomonas_calceolata.AAC.5
MACCPRSKCRAVHSRRVQARTSLNRLACNPLQLNEGCASGDGKVDCQLPIDDDEWPREEFRQRKRGIVAPKHSWPQDAYDGAPFAPPFIHGCYREGEMGQLSRKLRGADRQLADLHLLGEKSGLVLPGPCYAHITFKPSLSA